MSGFADEAIKSVYFGELTFCKFLSANDTGETGGHQAGIYISKPSIKILFDEPGIKGSNKERWVRVLWQDGFFTDTRFIYYGQGTRNEYRITNFGRGFPYLKPEYTGALFVFVKKTQEDYEAFVLNDEEDINSFLDAFGLTPAETNRLLDKSGDVLDPETRESLAINEFIASLETEFPVSEEMSRAARMITYKVLMSETMIQSDPDKILLAWTEEEYRIFKALENARYSEMISGGFATVDDFVRVANHVLNRRKSRAGKSLEHHLAAIFDGNEIRYTAQAVTEGNKKPDFLFPSEAVYHDLSFPSAGLISLAAKTTCKDRWRQVLNEADRLRDREKYLCTLQQGISGAQMDEMQSEGVILVVPKAYISTYPRDRQDRIWTIKRFVDYVMETEKKYG